MGNQRNTQEPGQDPAGNPGGLAGATPPRGGMSEEVGDLDDAAEDEGDDEEEIGDGSLPGRMGGGLAGA